MSTLHLPKDKYLVVVNATVESVGIVYLGGHDFTVDGFMQAHDAFVNSLSRSGMPGPIINVAIDASIRYADAIRLAGDKAHDMLVAHNNCPYCA